MRDFRGLLRLTDRQMEKLAFGMDPTDSFSSFDSTPTAPGAFRSDMQDRIFPPVEPGKVGLVSPAESVRYGAGRLAGRAVNSMIKRIPDTRLNTDFMKFDHKLPESGFMGGFYKGQSDVPLSDKDKRNLVAANANVYLTSPDVAEGAQKVQDRAVEMMRRAGYSDEQIAQFKDKWNRNAPEAAANLYDSTAFNLHGGEVRDNGNRKGYTRWTPETAALSGMFPMWQASLYGKDPVQWKKFVEAHDWGRDAGYPISDDVKYPYFDSYSKVGRERWDPEYAQAKAKAFNAEVGGIPRNSFLYPDANGLPPEGMGAVRPDAFGGEYPIYVYGLGGTANNQGNTMSKKSPIGRSVVGQRVNPSSFSHDDVGGVMKTVDTARRYGMKPLLIGHSLGGGTVENLAESVPDGRVVSLDPVNPMYKIPAVARRPIQGNVTRWQPDSYSLKSMADVSAVAGGRPEGRSGTYEGGHTVGVPRILDFELAKATGRLPEYFQADSEGRYNEDPNSIPFTWGVPAEKVFK